MQTATKKVVKAIKSQLKGFDKRSPVEQMAVYFAIGDKLEEVLDDEGTYGATTMKDIVDSVPQLKDVRRAYGIRAISMASETGKEYILEQTAIPMSNGQHLTLGHWLWVMMHEPTGGPAEQEEWLLGELAWLRRESPSETVIEHVERVLEERHDREMKTVREETVQEAIGLLRSL